MFEQFLKDLSAGKKLGWLAVAVVVVIVLVGAAWWSFRPVYEPLFSGLGQQDMAEVTQALDRMHVSYHFGKDGRSILVPKSAVLHTRMKLTSQGVPAHGSVGLELFSNPDYGMTEFAQKVNYQRALQGELERTIDSLDNVREARVHLTLKKQGLFLKDEQKPKASITIATKGDKPLTTRQLVGIQNLVAAAVDGLQPAAVVILGQDGSPLAGASADGVDTGNLDLRLQDKWQIEHAIRKKVSDMLVKVFGLNDFSVSVDATLNFDRTKQVQENVLPAGKNGAGLVVRKKETRTHAPQHAGHAASTAANHDDTEVEYAHGKSYREVESAPGRLERLTVGIIMPPVLSKAQRAKLAQVVAAAVGIDPARGDRLEIAALPSAAPTGAAVKQAAKAAPAPSPKAASGHSPILSASIVSPRIWLLASAVLLLVLLGLLTGGRRSRPQRDEPRLDAQARDDLLTELEAWASGREMVEEA
jgi:flagellar M-ring protein FliF